MKQTDMAIITPVIKGSFLLLRQQKELPAV